VASTKIVGVLGGMGPHATAAFFQALLNLTPATRDWDHLRIVIDNNPHIPSRTRHLLYGEPSPAPGMLESCRKLERYPVDMIALPCNNAAIHVPELQPLLSVPLLNIIGIAVEGLVRNHPHVKRVAALGGRVTYATQSYRPYLEVRGLELVHHGLEMQEAIETQIESLKLGQARQSNVEAVSAIFTKLRQTFEVEGVILACTEFRCLSELDAGTLPVVDSSLELARHTLKAAMP
jgi:aspartate racemase